MNNKLIREMIQIELLYQVSKRLKNNKRGLLREGADEGSGNPKFWDNFFSDSFQKFLNTAKAIAGAYEQIINKLNNTQYVKGGKLSVKEDDFPDFKNELENILKSCGISVDTESLDKFINNCKAKDKTLNVAFERSILQNNNIFDAHNLNSNSINNLWSIYQFFQENTKDFFSQLTKSLLNKLVIEYKGREAKTGTINTLSTFSSDNPVIINLGSIIANKLRECKLEENQISDLCNKLFLEKNLNEKHFKDIFNFPFSKYKIDDIKNQESQLFTDLLTGNLSSNYYTHIAYNIIEKPGTMKFGPGKGEFLLLSLLDGFVSGGARLRDLIGPGGFEVELKQTKENPKTLDDTSKVDKQSYDNFKLYFKKGKKSSAIRDSVFLSIKNFVTKFAEHTSEMNNLFKLTDNLETIAFNEQFIYFPREGTKASGVSGTNIGSDKQMAILGLDQGVISQLTETNETSYRNASSKALTEFVATINDQYGKIATKSKDIARKMLNTDDNFMIKKDEHPDNIFGLFDLIKGSSPEMLNQLKQRSNEDRFFLFNDLSIDSTATKFLKGGTKYDPNNPDHEKYSDLFISPYQLYDNMNKYVKSFDIYSKDVSFTKLSLDQLEPLNKYFFQNITKKYCDSLILYEDFLDKFIEDLSGVDSKISKDLLSQLNKVDITKVDIANMDEVKQRQFKDLLKYKIFIDFSRGLSLDEEELIITFQHVDKDKKVKNIKKIINKIDDVNPEFQIVEPANINLDSFMKGNYDNDDITLKLKDEHLSSHEIENILNNKSMFSFFNTSKKKLTNESSNAYEKEIAIKNKNVLEYLNEVIDNVIKLHVEIQDEYSNNAMLILSDDASNDKSKAFNQFKIIFGPSNKNNYSIKSMSDFENLVEGQKHFILTLQPSEVVWGKAGGERQGSEFLLGLLLNIKQNIETLISKIDERKTKIVEKVAKIKTILNAKGKNVNKMSQIKDNL